MGYQPPLPNSSRLIDWGHSWVAPPPTPYETSSISTQSALSTDTLFPWDGNQWPAALRDALGVGSLNIKSYSVPARAAGTATTNTFLDFMPADGTIEAVWYVPNAALSGANTNTTGIGVGVQNYLNSPVLIGTINFTSGINMALWTPIQVLGINEGLGMISAVGTPEIVSPYFPALRGVASGGTVPTPQEIYWSSIKVGTGLADPGGTVIVRYGTRYRNYAVVGATLLGPGNCAQATWNTILSWSPFSRPNAVEVNVTANASSSATSISCTALQYAIPSGVQINFSSGHIATLTAPALFAATSITVSALANAINQGEQGHAQAQNGNGEGTYESLSPTGINIFTYGVNDADVSTQDRPAWIETVRACIAKVMCPAWMYSSQGNWKYTNGGGTWSTVAAVAGGALPYTVTPDLNEGIARWNGTVSGTPKVDITVGPAFEGGTIDVMLLALGGASLGVAGTITVDGATPPQGSVTFNTSGVSTSGLITRGVAGTSATASGSKTVTGSGSDYSSADVGKHIKLANTVAGSIITAVASATSITISDNATATASGLSASTRGFVPMVKRLTGLAAGAHTITLTITGSDSTANAALYLYGTGLESANPTTPVLWCNIPACPGQTSGQRTADVNLNTDSASVINGTATPPTGNTAESTLTPNVVLVDLYTVFGGATPNATLFLPDGIHFNSAGHRLVARTLFSAIRNNFSPDQLMSR